MNIKNILANKKSSASGAALLLTGIAGLLSAYAGGSLDSETITLAITAILAGLNGIVGRDADVTSEQSGANNHNQSKSGY